MGFLNPLALWGGLAAAGVAVPIIIHLLYRKNRRETTWAAMELLRRALVVRSGQVKLEDFLILFLRCLAVFLLAAALLRPTLDSDSAAWLGESRVGMVVAVDASYSMGHGEPSRFEKAIGRAKEILDTAREGDPVSLVLMSNRPQVLLRRTGYSSQTMAEVLDGITPTRYRLSLERNIDRLAELVAELKTSARECYLVTDAQEIDWGSLSERGQRALEQLTKSASVFVVPVTGEGEENLSIGRLAYDSGSLQRAGVARFTADVRNEGRRSADGGTLEFFVGDELVKRRVVGALEAGEERAVSFFTSFDSAGEQRLQVQLGKDALAADNDRYAVVSVAPSVRVLCVDGDLSGEERGDRSGAYYAVRALRLRTGDADGPVQVQHIEAADLSLETLDEYDVILMANVADIASEMVQRVHRFVRRGGGLILFLGDGVDAATYEKRLGSGETGLLPGKPIATATFEKSAAGTNAGWAIAPVKSGHVLARVVRRLPRSLADSIRITKVMKVEPSSAGETILRIAETELPLLLSRDVGSGTVLMFTTAADRSWSELPVHPVYAMLLQQSVTNLTCHPDARRLTVGEAAEVAIGQRQVGEVVKVSNAAGDVTEVKLTSRGQQTVCPIDAEKVGWYEVAASADAPAVSVAVNVDPAESNVRVVDGGALSSQLRPLGVKVALESEVMAKITEDSRRGRELAHLLLLLGIIAFLLQSLLAKRFTDRMSHGDAGVSASLQMSKVAAARRS